MSQSLDISLRLGNSSQHHEDFHLNRFITKKNKNSKRRQTTSLFTSTEAATSTSISSRASAATTTIPTTATTTNQQQHEQRNKTPLLPSSICLKCTRTMQLLVVTTCLVFVLTAQQGQAATRYNQLAKQTNQYLLNEFCNLESKVHRPTKPVPNENNTVYLSPKNSASSFRVTPHKRPPSSISFAFGSSGAREATPTAPLVKQVNCSVIVVAPKSHGLLVTVNSIGLPKNLTKLGIILNHESAHAQHVHLEGETTSAQYLLTQPQSSKIAINLQSFQPIDWSHVKFDILFTVYKKANGTGGCPNKKWFDCGDDICVPSSLVCDKNRNCPNGNDEMIFYRCYSPLFWSVAASSALALILVVLIISIMIVIRNRRAGRLSKMNSFSNNQLAVDSDLMQDAGSKLDLTQADMHRLAQGGHNASYLASNLYLGGFENPVWNANGTLTKQASQQHRPSSSNAFIQHHQQPPPSSESPPTTTEAQIERH